MPSTVWVGRGYEETPYGALWRLVEAGVLSKKDAKRISKILKA